MQENISATTLTLAGDYRLIDSAAIGDDDHSGKWVVIYFANGALPPFLQVNRVKSFDTSTGTYFLEDPLDHDFDPADDPLTRAKMFNHNVAGDAQQVGNLFGEPTDAQAANGATIYRCIFFQQFEAAVEWERVHFYIDGALSQLPSNERYEIAVDARDPSPGTLTEFLSDEEDEPDLSELEDVAAARFSAPTIGEGDGGTKDQPTEPLASEIEAPTNANRAVWVKRIIDPQLPRATGDAVVALVAEGTSMEGQIGQIKSVCLIPILSASFAREANVRPDRGKPPVGVDRIIAEELDTTGLPASNTVAKTPIAPGSLRVFFDDGSGIPDLLEAPGDYMVNETTGEITWAGGHPLAASGYRVDYEVARAGVFDNEIDVQAGCRYVAEIRAQATGEPAPDVSVGWELTGLGSIVQPEELTDALGVARGVYTATKDDADDGELVSVEARVY